MAVEDTPTFRRPKAILPVPTPSLNFQHVQAGVPDSQLTREATGLLREFSTPLLFNHSHRVFFWANELGRQTGKKFDAELVFICAEDGQGERIVEGTDLLVATGRTPNTDR